jgi:hypothetical protein
MWRRAVLQQTPLVVTIGLFLWGCAVTKDHQAIYQNESRQEESLGFPPHHGPKRAIQIVRISIRPEDIQSYPELGKNLVGYGLYNMFKEILDRTGRFNIVEDRKEILTRQADLWKLSDSGADFTLLRVLEGVQFLFDAELFNFTACSRNESIWLFRKQLTCATTVGVQVSIHKREMARDSSPILGTTDLLTGEGTYVHSVNLPVFGDASLAFDQAAVGKATWKSTHYALIKALQKFDRVGW